MRFLAIALLFLAQAATADMGFYHPDALPPAVPASIGAAATSVFRLWVPGGNLKLKLLQWTSADLQTLKAQYESRGDYLTSSQLQFCLNTGVVPCVVMDDVTAGSGFIFEHGDQIATNRHVFLDYVDQWAAALKQIFPNMSDEEVARHVAYMPVPVLAFDQNGAKFNLGDFKSFAYFDYGPHSNSFGASDFLDTFTTDLAIIQLPTSVGNPLIRATQKAGIGERIYMLGYPQLTTDRQSGFGTPDSTGPSRLHVSYGPVVELKEALQRLGVLNSPIRDLSSRLDQNPTEQILWAKDVMFAWSDSDHGNSGGPVLNAQGEVVAIASGILREYRGNAPSLSVSVTINMVK